MEPQDKSRNNLAVKLGFTLFVITAITALLLSGVNAATTDPIAQHKAEALNQAMQSVMPGSTLLEDKTETTDTATVYTVQKSDGTYGYCVKVAPNGFGGKIEMLVGVDLFDDGKSAGKRVTGVVILGMQETAGLGTKAKDDSFLGQYAGKVYTIRQADGALNNAPSSIAVGSGENDIDAISGATITSKAVTKGVNMALDAVSGTKTEGGSAQ